MSNCQKTIDCNCYDEKCVNKRYTVYWVFLKNDARQNEQCGWNIRVRYIIKRYLYIFFLAIILL